MKAGLIARSYLDFFGSVFQSSVGYLISIVKPNLGNKSLNTNLPHLWFLQELVCLRKIPLRGPKILTPVCTVKTNKEKLLRPFMVISGWI